MYGRQQCGSCQSYQRNCHRNEQRGCTRGKFSSIVMVEALVGGALAEDVLARVITMDEAEEGSSLVVLDC